MSLVLTTDSFGAEDEKVTDLTDGGVRCERLEDRNNGGEEYSSISKR